MNDKIAFVTGAGSGIGRAVALGLAADGWRVALFGRRRAPLEETLAAASGCGLAISGDVGDPAAVRAAFDQVVAEWGRLDLLFNNAGTGAPPLPIDQIDDDTWERVIRTNLTGAFHCAREAFRVMRAQTPRGGRIINNGSVSAQAPRPGSVPYTASKHAITGLTKSLSLDGRAHDIACGQIDIGNVATELAAQIGRGVPQADGQLRAEPMMELKDVVDAVCFMAALPMSANVPFITVMATKMPLVGRG